MMASRRPRSGGGGSQPKFIYQLPLRQYKEIEDLLNMNEAWEHLAGQILYFKVTEIEKFRRHNQKSDSSAAGALLNLLCNKNTTIEEMFGYLHKIQLFRGMDILKEFVPERLHSMIRYGADLTQTQSLPYIPTYKDYSHHLHVPPKMNSQDFNVDDTVSQNVSARYNPMSVARQSGYRPAFQRYPTYEDRQSGQLRLTGQSSPGPEGHIRYPGQISPGPDGHVRYPGQSSPGPDGHVRYPGQSSPGPDGHVRCPVQSSHDGYPGHAYPSFERGPYQPQNRAPYPIYERSEHPSIQTEQYSQHPSIPPFGRYHSIERPVYQDYQSAERYGNPSNEQSFPYQQYGASPGTSYPPSEFMRRTRIRNPSEPTSEVSAASSVGGVPTVSDKELAEACDNWNIKNRIGKGGYGEVYRGVWKYQDVAVKRIRKMEHLTPQDEEHFQHSIKQCWKEINYLNRLRSEYIVPILAHSASGEPCIAYQFMPNGSLHDRLKKSGGTPALSWQQRYNIAKGVACGLQFLHRLDSQEQRTLIHGDIKSANILLDKAFEPKIGDFGLAREKRDPKNTHMKLSQIHGTQFYLPDDFLRTKQLSTKVDTYSFGVVLFDLVTGKSPSYKDPVTNTHLLDILKGEESLPGAWVDTSWSEHTQDFHLCALLFKFGKWCTKERKKERPEMKEVFEGLQRELERIRIRKESGPEHKNLTPFELQQQHDSMERQNSIGGVKEQAGCGGDCIMKDAQNVMGVYKISGGGFTIAEGGSEGGGSVEKKDENVLERKDRQSVPDLIRFSSSSSNTSTGESTGIVRVSSESAMTTPRESLENSVGRNALSPLPESTSRYSDICVIKDSSQKCMNSNNMPRTTPCSNNTPETHLESTNIPNLSILVETNSCDMLDFANLAGPDSGAIPDISSLTKPEYQNRLQNSLERTQIDYLSDLGASQLRISNQIKSNQIPDMSALTISDCSGALPDLSGLVGGNNQESLPEFSFSGEVSLVLPDFSQLTSTQQTLGDDDRLDSIENSAEQAEILLRALF